MVSEKRKVSIKDLILEFFHSHPNEEMEHGPVVDYVEKRYIKLHNRKPRDTWRSIRGLHQEGILIKIKKGIYKFDPDFEKKRILFDFSPETKEQIFQRDNYKCVICGKGKKDGVEIQADHILPRDKGGENTFENGQTLCSKHNFQKKNYSQYEFSKKLFFGWLKTANKYKDNDMIKFCEEVIEVFNKYRINNHIDPGK